MCHGFVFLKFFFFFSFISLFPRRPFTLLYTQVVFSPFDDHVEILSFFFRPSLSVTVTNFREQIELPIAMQQSAKPRFNHELRKHSTGRQNIKKKDKKRGERGGHPSVPAGAQLVSTAVGRVNASGCQTTDTITSFLTNKRDDLAAKQFSAFETSDGFVDGHPS